MIPFVKVDTIDWRPSPILTNGSPNPMVLLDRSIPAAPIRDDDGHRDDSSDLNSQLNFMEQAPKLDLTLKETVSVDPGSVNYPVTYGVGVGLLTES